MQKGVVRKRRTNPPSEYGQQLAQKQELKNQYNLRERQLKSYIAKAVSAKGTGNTAELLMKLLESRLDSIVFRMGMAQTKKQARQMVAHGHFEVNNRLVYVPSYLVKKGDTISLHQLSQKTTLFQNVKLALKKYQPPPWIQLDKEKMEGMVAAEPTLAEIAPTVELPLVFEFYSR